MVVTLQNEVDQLTYEKSQYVEQLTITNQEAEQAEAKIANSSVKEYEVVVVSALIEEKVRLAEAKVQLKKNCREEKTRLD